MVPCYISTLNSPFCLHEEQTLCQKLRRIWANCEKFPQLLNLRASRAADWDPATKNPPVGVTSQLAVLVSFSCAPEECSDGTFHVDAVLWEIVVLPTSKLESLEPRHKKKNSSFRKDAVFLFGWLVAEVVFYHRLDHDSKLRIRKTYTHLTSRPKTTSMHCFSLLFFWKELKNGVWGPQKNRCV